MLKTSGFVLFAKLLVAGLNFATIIFISRWLGPADRGVCSWYLVVIAVSLVFSETISGPTAGFLTNKYQLQPVKNISYVWAIVTSLGVVSVFLLLKKINSNEWMLLVLLCWLNAANSIHLHLLLAFRKFKLFNGLTILMPLMVTGVLLCLFLKGFTSVKSYLYSLLLAWLVAFIFGVIIVNKLEQQQRTTARIGEIVKEGFKNGVANQLSHIAGLLNTRMIFFLLPATLLGVYSNALSLAEASLMIPGSLGQVMYSTILNDPGENKAKSSLWFNWWLTIFLLFVACILVLILPGQLYELIFGLSFSGVKHFLTFLSIAMIFNGGYLILSYWQSAHGHFIKNFYANLAALIVNIMVSAFFFLRGNYTLQNGILALSFGLATQLFVAILQFSRRNKQQPLS